ncbi:MAG: hypothetical protein RLN87_10170 [Parasphingopyxis sp.]|uniref:hypothetical protein n=1 Tax=Parasphingopyxis sp. TaxID=1920299 RepID=UPI0032ECEDF2
MIAVSRKLRVGGLARESGVMVISRLFAFVAALAMLLAPLAMVGSGSAHAMPTAASPTMATGHCADRPDDATYAQPCGTTDCVASCSTIAATFQAFAVFIPAPVARLSAKAIPTRLGREAEFEPPPPRSS